MQGRCKIQWVQRHRRSAVAHGKIDSAYRLFGAGDRPPSLEPLMRLAGDYFRPAAVEMTCVDKGGGIGVSQRGQNIQTTYALTAGKRRNRFLRQRGRGARLELQAKRKYHDGERLSVPNNIIPQREQLVEESVIPRSNSPW